MKTFISLLFALLLIALNSCNTIENPVIPKTIKLDEKSAQLVEADNAFGLEIFRKIRKESIDDNIMISPLSISLALGMAYNGAAANTKTEMEEAMKLNGLTAEQINNSYKILIAALQSLDEEVVFEIANAIFYDEYFSVKQDFLSINQSYYQAEVSGIDFSNPTSVTTINSWVANKTHDKITSIINNLSPSDKMVLLNAIYFYGNWSTEFDKEGTKMRNFNLPDGTTTEVPTMHKEDKLEYVSNGLFSAIKLPYGNGQYNMMVLLPTEGENTQSLIDELSVDNWLNWANDFEIHDNVVVTMPRFKFAFDIQLKNVLKQMGMQKAFSEFSADFSHISDVDLFISSVIHKTYIDVNETGTEAAAVTAIVFTTNSADPIGPQKTYFNVNRPFLFAITENDTDAILFIGEVQDPKYEE
jgi:serpin B